MFDSLECWEKQSEEGGQTRQLHVPRKVNVKMTGDGNDPGITGCAEMPNGYIVLCDTNNRKIKLLDNSLELKDSLELPDSPWDVSVLDDKNIIVTIVHKLSQQLQIIQVFPQLMAERVFSDRYYAKGIAVFGDNIHVCCHVGDSNRGHVRIFDRQGNKKSQLDVMKSGSGMFAKKTYTFRVPNYIAIKSDRDRMCISDLGDFSVTCFTMDGCFIFRYVPSGTHPHGMCFDDNDNVLVCDSETECITKIEHNGITADVILTSKDGLKKPYSVLFRKSDNTLVVGCMDQNDLLIYKYK